MCRGNPPPIGDAVVNTGTGLLRSSEAAVGEYSRGDAGGVGGARRAWAPPPGVEIDPPLRPATSSRPPSEPRMVAALRRGPLRRVLSAFSTSEERVHHVPPCPFSLLRGGLLLTERRYPRHDFSSGLIIALESWWTTPIIDVENIARRSGCTPDGDPALRSRRARVVSRAERGLLRERDRRSVFVPVSAPRPRGVLFRPLATAYSSRSGPRSAALTVTDPARAAPLTAAAGRRRAGRTRR